MPRDVDFELPLPPWTYEALGEALYNKLAVELGYLNPGSDQSFRPALDPTPYLDTIRAQQAAKQEG